jgi:hypothetical protein
MPDQVVVGGVSHHSVGPAQRHENRSRQEHLPLEDPVELRAAARADGPHKIRGLQAVGEDLLAHELRVFRGRSLGLQRIEMPREDDDRGATQAERQRRHDCEAKDESRRPLLGM